MIMFVQFCGLLSYTRDWHRLELAALGSKSDFDSATFQKFKNDLDFSKKHRYSDADCNMYRQGWFVQGIR